MFTGSSSFLISKQGEGVDCRSHKMTAISVIVFEETSSAILWHKNILM